MNRNDDRVMLLLQMEIPSLADVPGNDNIIYTFDFLKNSAKQLLNLIQGFGRMKVLLHRKILLMIVGHFHFEGFFLQERFFI
jgi:hypothetical protein